jgi:hypothetical protein
VVALDEQHLHQQSGAGVELVGRRLDHLAGAAGVVQAAWAGR